MGWAELDKAGLELDRLAGGEIFGWGTEIGGEDRVRPKGMRLEVIGASSVARVGEISWRELGWEGGKFSVVGCCVEGGNFVGEFKEGNSTI